MEQRLDISRFKLLKEKETISNQSDMVSKLEVCTQSIFHWLQYCEYHYVNLVEAASKSHLKRDRIIYSYRREGETVPVRYVYEANVAAFLHSLHALIDSFPYLLNLFIPKEKNLESTSIKWNERFIVKYEGMSFYDELVGLLMDITFHKVKGYVNTIKHKHLVRISNQCSHLEFEGYTYKKPYLDEKNKIRFQPEPVTGENVVSFIEKCHDELIPRLFNLCESVLVFKEQQLSKVV